MRSGEVLSSCDLVFHRGRSKAVGYLPLEKSRKFVCRDMLRTLNRWTGKANSHTTDNENRAEEAEAAKQEQLKKVKQGTNEWHDALASDSEADVRWEHLGSAAKVMRADLIVRR